MRLIDANTLVGADGLFSKRGCPGRCQYCNLWSKEGCKVILEAPAVDAVEVVHGQWVYDHWCEFKCSVCGEYSSSKPYKGKENYCPNCGAKMDGGKNENL